jgi:Flp pilus assembly protein TadB
VPLKDTELDGEDRDLAGLLQHLSMRRKSGPRPERKARREEAQSMSLIHVVLVLIVVGVLLWLIDRFIPMAGSIKSILNAVVVIAVVLWLLSVFGLLSSVAAIHVPR